MGFAGVGVLENVEALGVGGHQTVLDAVVDHLDEVACAGGAAVEIAFFGGAACFLASRSTRSVSASRSERFENGIEMADGVVFAADHLAIAALQSPHAAAGADINIVNALFRKLLGAANIIDVIGVATIDDDVA